MQNNDNPDARHLSELLTSFNMKQYINGPTHRCGGTLDLLITSADFELENISVKPPGIISDHSLVCCSLPLAVASEPPTTRLVRSWRRVDRVSLRQAILDSPLCQSVVVNSDVDHLTDTYNNVLLDISDRLAPLHNVQDRSDRRAPWFDDECRQARRDCRRHEQRYRRSGNMADRVQWIDHTRRRLRLYRLKKTAYWKDKVQRDGSTPASLWRSLSTLIGRDRRSEVASEYSADQFQSFFKEKITNIRAVTKDNQSSSVPQSASTCFTSFRVMSEADIRHVIMTSPVKSCTLDPIPTFLVREFIDLLLPFITAIVNTSLSCGKLPSSLKLAILRPCLKKTTLDPTDMANYRPISNLPFLSKIIERAVAQQINAYLIEENLLPRCQSAYRKFHSTETALLRVTSDALTAADDRCVTLLSLLDMSAAFDCVDHELLLLRLENQFGFKSDVLRWVTSFLTNRLERFQTSNSVSTTQQMCQGIPQGSVLGPLLFNLYTAELSTIVESHGMQFHQYADDCQVYISVPSDEAQSAIDRLSCCVSDLGDSLMASRLRLNPEKTIVIWLGSRQQVAKIKPASVDILSTSITPVESVRNLGVMLDSNLTMSANVTAVCRSAFCFLRQLRPVIHSLPTDAAKTLVHAFVSSRVDYCSSLFYNISDVLLRRLQAVQNAAARLITGTRRRDHITPVLLELHWLPVRQRIKYRLAVHVFKALHGMSPDYIADECTLIKHPGDRKLRSYDVLTCAVRRSHTRLGDRAFACAGPKLWNSLPIHLRDSDLQLNTFRRSLKTFLFSA